MRAIPLHIIDVARYLGRSDTNIRNVRDLAGKRLCAVNGSVSWQRVKIERGVPGCEDIN